MWLCGRDFAGKQSLPLTCSPHFLSLVHPAACAELENCKDPDAGFQILLSRLERECTGHVVGKDTFQKCPFGHSPKSVVHGSGEGGPLAGQRPGRCYVQKAQEQCCFMDPRAPGLTNSSSNLSTFHHFVACNFYTLHFIILHNGKKLKRRDYNFNMQMLMLAHIHAVLFNFQGCQRPFQKRSITETVLHSFAIPKPRNTVPWFCEQKADFPQENHRARKMSLLGRAKQNLETGSADSHGTNTGQSLVFKPEEY